MPGGELAHVTAETGYRCHASQDHTVAAPFTEMAWDHARRHPPQATERELVDAVADLLARAAAHDPDDTQDPNGPAEQTKRDRRVATARSPGTTSVPQSAA